MEVSSHLEERFETREEDSFDSESMSVLSSSSSSVNSALGAKSPPVQYGQEVPKPGGGIAAILNAIESESEYIGLLGYETLVSLASDPGSRRIISGANCQDIVLKKMVKFPDNLDLQTHGCSLLAKLIYDCTNLEEKIDIAAVILASMKSHHASVSLQTAACAALCQITFSPEAQRTLIEMEALETVTSALKSHKKSIQLLTIGFAALWGLLAYNSNAVERALSLGVIKKVLHGMSAYPQAASLQEHGCGVLWSLTMVDSARNTVVRAGGIPAVLSSIAHHPRNECVIEKAAQTLHILVKGTFQPAKLRSLLMTGRMETMLEAMKLYPDDVEIQKNGIAALCAVAMDDERCIRTLVASEGTRVILDVLNLLPHSKWTIERALKLLKVCTIKARGEIIAEGVVPVAVNLLRENHDSPLIQAEGCALLFQVGLSQHGQYTLREAGAEEVVVDALQAYPGNARVQSMGLAAVWALATDDKMRKQLRGRGARQLVMNAIERFPESNSVQRAGKMALERLRFRKGQACVIM